MENWVGSATRSHRPVPVRVARSILSMFSKLSTKCIDAKRDTDWVTRIAHKRDSSAMRSDSKANDAAWTQGYAMMTALHKVEEVAINSMY